MKSETLVEEQEKLIEQLGYTIRKERGTFQGSHCIVEGDKLVVINKKRPIELQMGIYARLLKDKQEELADFYIKPAVRKKLQELWDRLDQFEGEEESAE
ncbi:MAG: hypothetical protein ACQETE_03920 [Bacteroidota bacterium]|jgi:hypothetical protein